MKKSNSMKRVVSLHPAAKAFNEWLNNEEGKACTEGVQIGNELHGHYMENRCHRAFNAGWTNAIQTNKTVRKTSIGNAIEFLKENK